MDSQREYLCMKHKYFPQYPKIMNCMSNNALDKRRNQGRCIHLCELQKEKVNSLILIKEETLKLAKTYTNSKVISEKMEVVTAIDELVFRKQQQKSGKKQNPIIDEALLVVPDSKESQIIHLKKRIEKEEKKLLFRIKQREELKIFKYETSLNRKTHMKRNAAKIRQTRRRIETMKSELNTLA